MQENVSDARPEENIPETVGNMYGREGGPVKSRSAAEPLGIPFLGMGLEGTAIVPVASHTLGMAPG
jgi:hypothetical protein